MGIRKISLNCLCGSMSMIEGLANGESFLLVKQSCCFVLQRVCLTKTVYLQHECKILYVPSFIKVLIPFISDLVRVLLL